MADNANDDELVRKAQEAYSPEIQECMKQYNSAISQAGQKAGEDFVENEVGSAG